MNDIDDLYEPADQRDWTLDELAEREPGEPEQEPPLDLDAIEDSIRTYYAGSDDDSAKAAEDLVTVMSGLVAELRGARQRIAEFEALPTREEWTVTASASRLPMSTDRSVWGGTAEMVADYAAKHGAQMWRRMVSEHPAEPIDLDAPF